MALNCYSSSPVRFGRILGEEWESVAAQILSLPGRGGGRVELGGGGGVSYGWSARTFAGFDAFFFSLNFDRFLHSNYIQRITPKSFQGLERLRYL